MKGDGVFMQIPAEITGYIENCHSKYNQAELAEAARKLSKRYREQNSCGKSLISNEAEVLAYVTARMPATYGAVYSALRETLLRVPSFRADSVLDVGAGTGAASYAADVLLEPDRIICLERDFRMSSIGKELFSNASPALQNAAWEIFDITEGILPYHADFVVSSYVLNELDTQKLDDTILKLWSVADRILLLVEPGTPKGYSILNRARSILLNEKAHIIAPCVHEKGCPLPENDWCHFTCRIPRSRMHRQLKSADAPYEDEKFAYLAVTSDEVPVNHDGRILRHPEIGKGYLTMNVCTREGIRKVTYSKKDGALYKAARKAGAGDRIPLPASIEGKR